MPNKAPTYIAKNHVNRTCRCFQILPSFHRTVHHAHVDVLGVRKAVDAAVAIDAVPGLVAVAVVAATPAAECIAVLDEEAV